MINLSTKFKDKITKILPEIIDIRHTIHKHPELSNKEQNTADLICQKLTSWGYTPVRSTTSTGITAILDSNKPGKTVALRADMDALPILEKAQVPYASTTPGIMHACGHDGHIASLLLAAYLLRDAEFTGKIKLVFQPAEEIGEGAEAMIKDGALNNPTVDAIFGYHNIPTLPKNKVVVKQKCILAGCTRFKITINGVGGHSSTPEKTIDPIYIGTSIISGLHNLGIQNSDRAEPIVITVTQFHAGHADNVIPDTATLSGTIRFTDNQRIATIKDKMRTLVDELAKSHGGTATIDFVKSVPATVNHAAETNLVKKVAAELFGESNALDLDLNLMATEDFAYFLEKIPGCYFFVGTGVDKKFVHHPEYVFDDEIIPTAGTMLAAVALKYLERD